MLVLIVTTPRLLVEIVSSTPTVGPSAMAAANLPRGGTVAPAPPRLTMSPISKVQAPMVGVWLDVILIETGRSRVSCGGADTLPPHPASSMNTAADLIGFTN